MATPRDDNDDHQRDAPAPPLSEWITALIGLVLVAGCIGYLGWHGLAVERTPPDPVVQVGATQQLGERWHVPLRAHNRGRETAAALVLEGELKEGDKVVETAETEFQYLPGESSREAGLYFSRDPAGLRLEIRVKSYQKP